MEDFVITHSLKDIPLPPQKEYIEQLVEETAKFIRRHKSGVIRTTLTFLILGKTDILAFSDSFAIELSFVFWVYGLKQPLKASKWPLNFSLKP